MRTRDHISNLWNVVNKGHSADIPIEFHIDNIRIPIESQPEAKVIDGEKVMTIPASSVSFNEWLSDLGDDRFNDGHEAGYSEGYSEGYAEGVQAIRDKQDEIHLTK